MLRSPPNSLLPMTPSKAFCAFPCPITPLSSRSSLPTTPISVPGTPTSIRRQTRPAAVPSPRHLPSGTTDRTTLPITPSPSASSARAYTAGPSRIPETTSLDDALRYWNDGDTQAGLLEPLKTWRQKYKSSELGPEAQKLSMIEKVVHEFQVQYRGDWTEFEAAYPGLRKRYTRLVAAVRQARKDRGETKSRKSRRA